MRVKVKKLHEDAVLPFKNYNSDFCYDVLAVSEEEIAPNVWKYGLGLSFQIERGNEVISNSCLGYDYDECESIDFRGFFGKISIDFRPRSSVWKTGMVLSNSEGTIDENYRGEVCAIFFHVMKDMERYHVGDKIGQIKLGFTLPIEFEEVDELENTDRGNKGYGSTGK